MAEIDAATPSLIYDSLHEVVLLLNVEPDGGYRFASANRSFLAGMGLTLERIVGKRIDEVMPTATHPQVIGKYEEAIRSRAPVSWGRGKSNEVFKSKSLAEKAT